MNARGLRLYAMRLTTALEGYSKEGSKANGVQDNRRHRRTSQSCTSCRCKPHVARRCVGSLQMHAEWRVLHVVCAHGVLSAACYASLQMQAERRALLTQKKRRVRHLKEAAAALMAERANLGNEMDRSGSDAHTIATVRLRVPTRLGHIRTVAGVQVAHVGAGMLHRARKSIMDKQSMAAEIEVEDLIHVPGAVPVPPTPRQEKAQGHARDQSKVGGCLTHN